MDTLCPAPSLPAAPWRWALWLTYLAAWSAALLVPNPAVLALNRAEAEHALTAERKEELSKDIFAFSKVVHVSVYAVAAGLTAWLRTSRGVRWVLVDLLCQHAVATEILQRGVPTR
ncbi:MAG TPA: hypothetical protein VFA26_13810, partial [Gemmataceae bacterium]|nr:hypothetical protein [Gemmataceae bacterium]